MTAGPNMGPTPAAELMQRAQEASLQGQLAQQQSRDLTQGGIARALAAHDNDMAIGASNAQVASNLMDRNPLNGPVVKGLMIGGLITWLFLPCKKAQRAAGIAFFTMTAGLMLLDWDPDRHAGLAYEEITFWQHFFGDMTIWSAILLPISAYFWVMFWVRMGRHNRAARAARRQQQYFVEPVEEQAAAAPRPAPAPRPATAPPVRADTQSTVSKTKLWVPQPQRRVRRGGTTLSGIPIKDRRTVDPRSL
jgi:hypothetical protein